MLTVTRGAIFMIPDGALTLPPESLRGEVHKERRPFVILTNNESILDPNFPIVTGCPISSSTNFRTSFDVKLPAGEGGVVKKCWVRIPAIQPLAKSVVLTQDMCGTLSPAYLEAIDVAIAEYLNLGG